MQVAIAAARCAEGRSGPNPPVGCAIISSDGQLVAVGHTALGGRPHAETEALAMAGEAAQGATAYVTLEPCAHTGQTGPCADALVEAGVARVVIAAAMTTRATPASTSASAQGPVCPVWAQGSSVT